MSKLGSGGMATVHLAEDTLLQREVALKRVSVADDREGLSRLRREALTGASVSHPNLVSVYDVITTESGDVVIVMEYVPGETLSEALRRRGALPVPEALRILSGVAAALDTIHERGIIHRDVKPANILLRTDGEAKLADLGVASVPDQTRITAAGTVVGSFKYMAPEQIHGDEPDAAIDIYALSAVAYAVLSGQSARNEANPIALAHAIATQPPPDLRAVRPEMPAAAADLLMRGMAHDPRERPRSAGELIDRLRSALEPQPPVEPSPDRAETAVVTRAQPMPVATAAPGPVHHRRAPAAAAPSPLSVAPRRRRPRPLALLALAAGALALALVIIAAAGSAGPATPPAKRGAKRAGIHRVARQHSTPGSAAAGAPITTASGSGAGDAKPVAAVESFYENAAAHRYAAAWALADPTFRSQLGGYASFEDGQAGDRSITFTGARVISRSAGAATVAVSTTSVRTTGTQHCTGTVDTVAGGSGGSWLLHLIHISCTPA